MANGKRCLKPCSLGLGAPKPQACIQLLERHRQVVALVATLQATLVETRKGAMGTNPTKTLKGTLKGALIQGTLKGTILKEL